MYNFFFFQVCVQECIPPQNTKHELLVYCTSTTLAAPPQCNTDTELKPKNPNDKKLLKPKSTLEWPQCAQFNVQGGGGASSVCRRGRGGVCDGDQ